MTLRQMEYLLTVIREQSFTRASDHLNVSQSAHGQSPADGEQDTRTRDQGCHQPVTCSRSP
ncbi:MAG: LysR family transcriptional regulator [Nocardioidaceae bacterium]